MIAWTTAAVNNQRVLAAIPAVINILNIQKVSEKSLSIFSITKYFLLIEFHASLSSML